jgi:hypothetical protein
VFEDGQALASGAQLIAAQQSMDGAGGNDHGVLQQLSGDPGRAPGGPGDGQGEHLPLIVWCHHGRPAHSGLGALGMQSIRPVLLVPLTPAIDDRPRDSYLASRCAHAYLPCPGQHAQS